MLYNTLGQSIAEGYTTPANFAGPPLVLVGDALTESDNRWLQASNLADRRRCPLVGIGITAADADELVERLQVLRALFGPNGDLTWWSAETGTTQAYPPCGPILASGGLAAQDAAWALSARCLRLNAQHLFGVGMCAVGPDAIGGRLTPPVYLFNTPDDAVVARLDGLWRGRAPTLEEREATLAVDEVRPGFSLRTHPTLLTNLVF